MNRFFGKPKPDRYLEPKEFEAILSVTKSDPEAHFFFRVMGATGMRSIEAERLEVKHIDRGRQGLWIWTAKRHDHPTRFVALDKGTWKLLEETLGGRTEGPIFFYKKEPLTVRRMKHLFKKYGEKARIRPALSMHSLRHFHGTACMELGMSPQEVAMRLGHKKLDMVMEYSTLRVERNRELASRFGSSIFGERDEE